MTKDKKKLLQLNLIMDNALGGATAGLLALDSLLVPSKGYITFKGSLEALAVILHQRRNLQTAIELLSRPVEQKPDGTLYYTGKSR